MHTTRMEAFTDGVIAILITVMVLELHDPEGSSWHDLRTVIPTVLIYLLSFVYIGIYWNIHHHMLQLTERVNGMILWANLHLLAQAFGRDRNGRASVLLYVVGIVLALVNRWAGLAVFTAVALMWFIPDRRVEAVIRREDDVSNR